MVFDRLDLRIAQHGQDQFVPCRGRDGGLVDRRAGVDEDGCFDPGLAQRERLGAVDQGQRMGAALQRAARAIASVPKP